MLILSGLIPQTSGSEKDKRGTLQIKLNIGQKVMVSKLIPRRLCPEVDHYISSKDLVEPKKPSCEQTHDGFFKNSTEFS